MQIVIEIPEEIIKTRYYTDYFGCGSHKLTETLDNATPYKRKGHWVHKGQGIYCSECGKESGYNPFGASRFSDYCPNCGADMREGERE